MTTEAEWIYTADFYNRQERSRQVRQACLTILTLLDDLSRVKDIHDTADISVAARKDLKIEMRKLLSQLEIAESLLIELGIQVDSRAGGFDEEDPVEMAEWLAGQIRAYLGLDPNFKTEKVDEFTQSMFFYLDAESPRWED